MTTTLGKRKSRHEPPVSEEEAQAIFRRHFEAQFLPLPEPKPSTTTSSLEDSDDAAGADGSLLSSPEDDDDEEGDDEWDGLSDSETTTPEATVVEVVDYTKTTITNTSTTLSKRETKALLSSKVPSALSSITTTSTSKAKPMPADEDSTDLLKNDLALQRLISESHLLNPTKHASSVIGSSAGAAATEHSGRNRHLATDLRMAALGSRSSIYTQAKMPMSHRKGIEGAKAAREEKRRREAKENGIILERPAPKKGKGDARRGNRERAVDAPTVGKLRNGMLKLSKRDVAEIQGGRGRRDGKMKKRRR